MVTKMTNGIQYSQPLVGGDPINQLPVDKNPPLPNEVHIIDTLFKKNRGAMDMIFEEAKDSVLVAAVVVLACMPQIDLFIYKMIPISQQSPYFLLLAKGLVAAFLYWIIKHFYLSRRNT
jgi:hypothetical protein